MRLNNSIRSTVCYAMSNYYRAKLQQLAAKTRGTDLTKREYMAFARRAYREYAGDPFMRKLPKLRADDVQGYIEWTHVVRINTRSGTRVCEVTLPELIPVLRRNVRVAVTVADDDPTAKRIMKFHSKDDSVDSIGRNIWSAAHWLLAQSPTLESALRAFPELEAILPNELKGQLTRRARLYPSPEQLSSAARLRQAIEDGIIAIDPLIPS